MPAIPDDVRDRHDAPLGRTAARFAALAAVSGMIAVASGAFATHALRATLEPSRLATFETAARQQAIHALALIAVAWGCDRLGGRILGAAGWLFVAGTVVFCGSLYTLALGGPRGFGALAPVGGLCLIAGWLLTAIGLSRSAR